MKEVALHKCGLECWKEASRTVGTCLPGGGRLQRGSMPFGPTEMDERIFETRRSQPQRLWQPADWLKLLDIAGSMLERNGGRHGVWKY